jgi:hypothetical protein
MPLTQVYHGSNRQLWFAALGASNPAYSFLEDAAGTSVTSGQVARSLRLGDPINTGPNDAWTQTTYQGGAQQDLWNDVQMFHKGNVDSLSWPGKFKMWPGLRSVWKKENHPNARSFAMGTSDRSDLDWRLTSIMVGERDMGPWEARAAHYNLWRLTPGYAQSDSRSVQHVHEGSSPYRIVMAIEADDYSAGKMCVTTATQFYILDTETDTLSQDTNAPSTSGLEFQHDSACSYQDAFYYCFGNKLYSRSAGSGAVLGTHTLIHEVHSAKYLRGMTVWNNRMYFGVWFGNGDASIYVSDGATTVKAFDFPHQFWITKIVQVAGSLFVLGMQPSSVGIPVADGEPNLVQQLWRYDGVSLKKMWQEGKMEDGSVHWASDLTVWEGMPVWGCQGNATSGVETGVANNEYACLMFYDPVNDAIVPGPGITVNNPLNKLSITAIGRWNETLLIGFKDDYTYPNLPGVNGPAMLAVLKPEDEVRDDFRYPLNGDDPQFQDPSTLSRVNEFYSSEFFGTEDISNVKKTWLSLSVRAKFTGPHAKCDLYVTRGIDDGITQEIFIGTIDQATSGATSDWIDSIVVPIKDVNNVLGGGASQYIQSKKLSVRFHLYNDDHGNPNSTDQVWIDDYTVQFILAPHKVRQWNVRIPLSDNQLRLDGTANPMATSAALESQIESFFYGGMPCLFWPPDDGTNGTSSGTSGAVEVTIQSMHATQSRLESTNTGDVGSVSLTITENVTSQ